MINKVTLIGNMGKDPEVRRLENGTAVARLTVATNESYRDKSGEWQTVTEWHNVICWRYLAERAETQLKKGSLVYVEGKLTTRKWQDKDGNDRYSTEVVANTFRSLERKENQGGGGFPSAADDPYSTQKEERPASPSPVVDTGKTEESPSEKPNDNFSEGDDGDLPF